MKQSIRIVTILTIIYFVCNMIGIVTNGILRFLPFVTITLTLFFFIKHKCWNTFSTTSRNKLIALWGVYVLIHGIINPAYNMPGYLTVLHAFYWVSIFFLFFKGGFSIQENRISNNIITIFIIIFVSYLINRILFPSGDISIGYNSCFYPLMMLPWLTLIKKPVWKWICLILLGAAVLLSVKRSCTIIYTLSIVVIYYNDFLKGKKGGITHFFIGIIILFTGYFMINNSTRFTVIKDRFSSIEEDGGSGRDRVFEDVIFRFNNFEIKDQIFGRGYNMVIAEDTETFVPISAHNDFLEVLYDYGYIGVTIFVLIHLSIILLGIKRYRRKSSDSIAIIVSYICFITMSMVSHLMIYPTYIAFLASFWGYITYKEYKRID